MAGGDGGLGRWPVAMAGLLRAIGAARRQRTLRPVEDTLGVRQGERETLEGFLDWYRAVVERKVDGLGS